MSSSCAFAGRPRVLTSQSRVPKCRSVRCVRVRAEKDTEEKVDPGFRWDPTLQRWTRDDRFAGKDFPTTVKTKTGEEYTVWPIMHTYLAKQGLKSLTPAEALELAKEGYTLVDVRVSDQYAKNHAQGAVNAPMYRYVTKDDFWNNLKKVAVGSMGMKATERNTDFASDVEKAVGGKSKIITMCGLGGTMETIVTVKHKPKQYADPDRGFGRESRSLKACYELLQAGFTEVYHMKGGVSQWSYDGLEMESSN